MHRVYVEKKAGKEAGFATDAESLKNDLQAFLGVQYPELKDLSSVRILRRYDVDGLTDDQFRAAIKNVFSEPQCDRVFVQTNVPVDTRFSSQYFGVSYLSGQFDQRADSAEQCTELVCGARPVIKCAAIYVLLKNTGSFSDETMTAVKKYIVNQVDSCEVSHDLPQTLVDDQPEMKPIPVLAGFSSAKNLEDYAKQYELAMSDGDLHCCQAYFAAIHRDPSLAELRVLDTYWSDHCRHTTFTTELEFDEESQGNIRQAFELYEKTRREVYEEKAAQRPRTLMDITTIGTRSLKKRGLLDDLDESSEINACTVKVTAEFADGSTEPWLLLFKNETHNHPTEIEPFGGAATCLGGAIRDPLSGRAFVYQAMRITGCGDPRQPLGETLNGKLPQMKIARESAAGYSSYGNQIGLATGQVAEFYHAGFVAKHMELGAVVGAVPSAWVRREEPRAGDVVLLVGGKTGRDGIGGATGSSKAHTGESVAKSGAEVQKGNPVEERKIQRLFRNPTVTRLIKRCNDFGAGGVAVAVGELAEGLDVNLDAAPKKYAGLDGIEMAISESQERMAVVVSEGDTEVFIRAAAAENLDAVVIARVTDDKRLRMFWMGRMIVDISREFLNSNGAVRRAKVILESKDFCRRTESSTFIKPQLPNLEKELASLRTCSRRGLQERFDGSIGAGSVLFPFGGATQGTPECGMSALLPSLDKESRTASLMTFGFDPDAMIVNPYEGAKGAVRESLAKIVCMGGDWRRARLSLQEYFERPDSPESWGKPTAALLGALEAQLTLGVPVIGGKDSMSGTFLADGKKLTVPPTLVTFAAGVAPVANVRSGSLSVAGGNSIVLFEFREADGWDVFMANLDTLVELGDTVKAAYPVGAGGVAATLAIMAFGNMVGVEIDAEKAPQNAGHGSILAEISEAKLEKFGTARIRGIGKTISFSKEPIFRVIYSGKTEEMPLSVLRSAYEQPLRRVYPQTGGNKSVIRAFNAQFSNKKPIFTPPFSNCNPLAVLPVFPGTNCEWDMERCFRRAGAETRQMVFRNNNRQAITDSITELALVVDTAQIIALSGGFSAGDEPDGSGKFIANVFRAPRVMDAVCRFLQRGGLILGICNGFQALIKLGLVPYGEFRAGAPSAPTLTFNSVGRHVSRMVRTRVASTASPWLSLDEPGTIHVVPVSHGEGRLVISADEAERLFAKGQVPFCYVDAHGYPAETEPYNPNGSAFAIEGLTSPDGRILGKMGHSERRGEFVHVNIPGNKYQRLFEAGVKFFKS
ncbi:MAG: phosphoribosylformylglycinamidine synthase [Treponema sp.]|jgi:phosphoribosylformylglycinamidine synthase|nr:phosphoribosylformylglycinamidine synthase [Treponema sp.]